MGSTLKPRVRFNRHLQDAAPGGDVYFMATQSFFASTAAITRPMEPVQPDGKPAAATPPLAMPADVLIVEDDAIIAIDFEDAIRGLGVPTVRVASTVAAALKVIAIRPPDFALLDIGLGTDTSFEIADRLDALGVPFAIVTGYRSDAVFLSRFANRPLLSKPYSMDELISVLKNWRAKAT
jgi:CheY-like chemotaxis protein